MQWAEWQRGIPSSREWCGRNGQNPYLLQAFGALERARSAAAQPPAPDPKALLERMKAGFLGPQ